MRAILAIALLPLLLLSVNAFGQAGASLSGTVMDTSQAVLPGAGITAINTQTGVETKTTANNVGVYSFPSLQTGVYNIVAKVDGFQTATKTDVKLGVGAQVRLNFEMVVAGTATEVEVATTAENMILDAGSSTGTVMQEELVGELPLVGNNVMELLNTMGGVVKAEEPIFSASTQTFAGVSSSGINITRDGVSANEVRYTSGITPPSNINQEVVGEFKMVLSPVDAELGRGAGQVQIITKSGANAFHGSGVWNNQNTALDAGKFEDKRIGNTPPWRNLNNYTISASGPIIRNKTFFFASWDHQLVRSKEWVTANALTGCARKGIYRYFDGIVGINANDNADYTIHAGYKMPRSVVVTSATDGTPKLHDAYGTSGQLMYQNVFGNDGGIVSLSELMNDCQGLPDLTPGSTGGMGVPLASTWDPNRVVADRTGYVSKYLDLMPVANYFGAGDGLNIAGYQWWRATSGSNNIFGTGEDNLRKQITIKIDHNISNAHRLSGTYTLEKNTGMDGGPVWPENSYIGINERKPQSVVAALTSTLSPTILNEFRFGFSRLTGYVNSSIDASEGKLAPILNDLTSGMNLTNYTGSMPVVVSYDALAFGPGSSTLVSGVSSPFSSRGIMNSTWGGTDHRWTVADTVTWMKGSHSFKGGFEMRLSKAWYSSDGEGGFSSTSSTAPAITGGNSNNITAEWNWPGTPVGEIPNPYTGVIQLAPMSTTNTYSNQASNALNLLNFLAGSVSDVRQYFYIVKNGSDYRWNNINSGENQYITDIRGREFSAFFKDDWKVTSDLTLNLGVRYEYYGVPWNNTGMTVALKGGMSSIQGAAGSTWMDWVGLSPSTEAVTMYEFVGPNSDNPGRRQWSKDYNNFAPHVGFAWQLPWLGKGKTTLRGGYSISYSPLANYDGYKGIIATVPGVATRVTGANDRSVYKDLSMVNDYLGAAALYPGFDPMRTITGMANSVSIYDENIRTPYTQSLNLSLTRQVGNAVTVDVRYIGTLGRNRLSSVNLNTPNYILNGLFNEFERVRAANGAATPDDEIPNLVNMLGPGAAAKFTSANPYGVFSNVTYGSGATQLAMGNYSGLASTLATLGNCGPNCYGSEWSGSIYTNPQFRSATLTQNKGYNNYHSMQAQVTMRPVRGLSFQATYTWSRNIADAGVGDYLTGARRYYLAGQHRSHALTTYGSYELPFGANGFIFRNATGAFKKAIEGWQLSWVGSASSGIPASLGGASSYWNISDAVVVRPDLWDNKAGKVTYDWGADGKTWQPASFYGDRYMKGPDPQCATVNRAVSSLCTLRALYIQNPDGSQGDLVIRNARPGEGWLTPLPDDQYFLTPNSLTGPGRWYLDMAMSKSIEFMEGKRIEFRVDASNIFNHATPSGSADAYNHAPRYDVINQPDFSLNSTNPLGYMATKAGHRTFQAKIRISF
jgi:hypothetical protein